MPRPRPSMSRLFYAAVLIGLCGIVVQACAPRRTIIWPVTEGFHAELPLPGSRFLILANDATAALTVADWLRARGMRVTGNTRMQRPRMEHGNQIPNRTTSLVRILQNSERVETDFLVLVEIEYETIGAGKSEDATHEEGLYSVHVAIQGINVETGKTKWQGFAEYFSLGAISAHRIDEALRKLSCQALATAWGERPPGKHQIASESMCGET